MNDSLNHGWDGRSTLAEADGLMLACSLMRQIKLTFIATGESVLADLLDEDAPQTCDYVWDLLPLEHKLTHGQFSGAEVFVLFDNPKRLPLENYTHLPLPGELLYYHSELGGVGSSNSYIGEICFIYGRGVTLRGHEGVPTKISLFARVPGDWKFDWTNFAAACKRVRWEGPSVLRIERA